MLKVKLGIKYLHYFIYIDYIMSDHNLQVLTLNTLIINNTITIIIYKI